MGKFYVFLSVVTILGLLSEANGACKAPDKVIKRKKKVLAGCLKKGYQSSLEGCVSGSGKPKRRQVKACTEVEKQLASCDVSCIEKVDGKYGPFGEWGTCSAACGGGSQSRTRECNNPAPANGGADCSGEASETQACNENVCPVNGGWSAPGEWSACSATCGGGTQSRSKICNSPAPANGGADCSGPASEVQACNEDACHCNNLLSLGCWRDEFSRAIDGGIRLRGDWEACRAYALARGWNIFAIQYGNECFTSANPNYQRYGRSGDCRDGRGGGWANDVYMIQCNGK